MIHRYNETVNPETWPSSRLLFDTARQAYMQSVIATFINLDDFYSGRYRFIIYLR